MGATNKPTFHFKNQVSPRYLEPLFVQLEFGIWYSTAQLTQQLRDNGLQVEGSDIVGQNTEIWSLAGLGQVRKDRVGRSNIKLFQLTPLGKQIIEIYSTNKDLFHDLIHFIFFSTWRRSSEIRRARFWLYSRVCEVLWLDAPSPMDSWGLTSRLQLEGMQSFPSFIPSFSERSVGAVFPWLGMLSPPFLTHCNSTSHLCSRRRSYCSPQLFQLACDLIYTSEGLKYGTSMAMDDQHINEISMVCLLDLDRFWEMAEIAQMAIRGLEIKKGQWGTSLVLHGPPNWIDLPDFSHDSAKGDIAGIDQEDNE